MTNTNNENNSSNNNSALILQKVKVMLEIQDALNAKVNPDWRNAGYMWSDATMVETTELFDHLNWKWWKKYKSEPDMGQVKMEAVDIWHFILSQYLELWKDSEEALAELIRVEWTQPVKAEIDQEEIKVGARTLQLVNIPSDALKEDPEVFDEVIAVFGHLLAELGMDLDDLYKLYVGKAKLNEFRWANDYGGSYIKDWLGQEDNQFLTELINSLHVNDFDFANDITKGLTKRYAEVKAVTEVSEKSNG